MVQHYFAALDEKRFLLKRHCTRFTRTHRYACSHSSSHD